MTTLDQLSDEDFAKAQEGRRVRIEALERAGYERWDMTPEGHERFRKAEMIVTLKFDPNTGDYRVVPETW